jgi:hypothetical protein
MELLRLGSSSRCCTAGEALAFPKASRETLADILCTLGISAANYRQDVARLWLKMNPRGQDALWVFMTLRMSTQADYASQPDR